jgi:hypothetical protein
VGGWPHPIDHGRLAGEHPKGADARWLVTAAQVACEPDEQYMPSHPRFIAVIDAFQQSFPLNTPSIEGCSAGDS